MKKFRFSDLRRNAMPALALLIAAGHSGQAWAATVYAFSQQKIYNMSITSSASFSAISTISSSSTDAVNLTGFLGLTNSNPAIDALQSKVGTFASPGLPIGRANPGENYIDASLFTPGVNVLTQANPTATGVTNNTDTTTPLVGDFNPNDQFARSDVFMTSPTGDPVGGVLPGQGQTPAGIPINGQGINSNTLFPLGGGTLGFDSVAEALLNSPLPSNGDATSSWLISGAFTLNGTAPVSLNFDSVERLVVFSDSPNITQVSAYDTLSFRVTTLNDNPVQTITSTRAIGLTSNGQITYNWSTAGGNSLPNGVNGTPIVFTTSTLAAGGYKYYIQGFTQSDVRINVPEPSTYVLMGLSTATIGGMAIRRKQKPAQVAIA